MAPRAAAHRSRAPSCHERRRARAESDLLGIRLGVPPDGSMRGVDLDGSIIGDGNRLAVLIDVTLGEATERDVRGLRPLLIRARLAAHARHRCCTKAHERHRERARSRERSTPRTRMLWFRPLVETTDAHRRREAARARGRRVARATMARSRSGASRTAWRFKPCSARLSVCCLAAAEQDRIARSTASSRGGMDARRRVAKSEKENMAERIDLRSPKLAAAAQSVLERSLTSLWKASRRTLKCLTWSAPFALCTARPQRSQR